MRQEELFSKLGGCKYFSLFDASNAFWHLQLDEASSRLCTFATPWGRYRFKRVPFGLNCAPEFFQRAIDEILKSEENFHLYFDDILITAKSKEQQWQLIHKLLTIARATGLKLNKNKMRISLKQIPFLEHILTTKGILPDPQKVSAIVNLKPPTNATELMRFLGMITFLTKFIPNFSQNTIQLRNLLKTNSPWTWDSNHDLEFRKIKHLLTSAPVLNYFNSEVPIVISTDASSYGIGSVLLQNQKPIAYASASLTQSQQQWAQIEKELLAVVYACERFHYYIYGSTVEVHTDHRPLIGLLRKPLSKITPRLQRLILRLQRYSLVLKYVPGRFLNIADTLSRTPEVNLVPEMLQNEQELSICTLIIASTPKMEQLKIQTKEDTVLKTVFQHLQKGWPNEKGIKNDDVKMYSRLTDELYICEDLICKGQALCIPKMAQQQILQDLHMAHRGITAVKAKARGTVYWPSMNKDIEEMIKRCTICQQNQNNNRREPLLDRQLPNRPWQKVAVDFFYHNHVTYLLMIDYFSKYIEVQPTRDTTAQGITLAMKSIFSRFGIPEELISDNGPPFNSEAIGKFLRSWDINYNPTAPYNPRANGQVERAVQTLKKSLTKAQQDKKDLYIVLMDYRSTPSHGLKSPAELLMGRKMRTIIPTLPTHLDPSYDISEAKNQLQKRQARQHTYADRGTKTLTPLSVDQSVWFAHNKGWEPGKIIQVGPQQRSYIIIGNRGSRYRRNRFHVKPRFQPEDSPSEPEDYIQESQPQDADKPQVLVDQVEAPYRTRYGRQIVRPRRFSD